MRRRDMIQRWTEFDPEGTKPGHPLVEIADDRRVLIEHHQGVVAYGCAEICVRVRFGQIRITGSALRLAKMSAEQLVICGRVDSVTLIKQGGGRR